jgi:cytochrome oxidase Cu insertion factor (SCO1/SenC/PrrC family)
LKYEPESTVTEFAVHPITSFAFSYISLVLCLLLSVGITGCKRPPPAADSNSAQENPENNLTSSTGNGQQSKGPPILMDSPVFELTDQLNGRYGTNELAGHVWIVNFIFTTCTATCPQQTERFAAIQKYIRRWPDWERVRLVSITVDPEHDTPARLHEYAKQHQANNEYWKFLTGERSELVKISETGFKLPVTLGKTDSSVPITHSARCILVDSNQKLRGYYDGLSEQDIRKLLEDVRWTLSESGQNTKDPVYVGVPPSVFDPPWLAARQAAQLDTRSDLSVFHDFKFVDRLPDSGIRFRNRAVPDAARDFKKNHYDHANGLAAGDVDGDGLPDLYFVSQVGGNQLWRNVGGGRFEDMTEAAGVALKGRVCVSASFADTDNDGDVDLFVTTTRHGNAFFENDGRGIFRDATEVSGLTHTGHSSSADFFDYDLDGKLDLFVTNVGVFTTDLVGYSGNPRKGEDPYWVGMNDAFAGHLFSDRFEANHMYHNEGNNRFREVSKEIGLVDSGWSGDATPIDINGDRWLDLYVSNMQGNDECYINMNGERFIKNDDEFFPNAVWGGMGVKSFDFDNSHGMDLFVTNMHADMWQLNEDINGPAEKRRPSGNRIPPASYLGNHDAAAKSIFGNALYSRDKDGKYQDVAIDMNAETYWPWGISTGDLNADGFQDVFITSCMNYPFRYHVNSVLLNERGQRFRDSEFILGVEPRRDNRTAAPWFELDCSVKDKMHDLAAGRTGRVVVCGAIGSRSAVVFDLDQDGDLDIVTNDFNTPPQVLISNLSERQPDFRFLKLRLSGKQSNKGGLGAKVQVDAGDQTLVRVYDGQSGYLSQSALPLYFGLGEAQTVSKITVNWPSGATQVLQGPISVNQELVVEEPGNGE